MISLLVSLTLLLVVVVVFVSGILSCFLKGKSRLIAVDTLLIAATLLIAGTLCAGLLLPDKPEKKSATKLKKALKACDSAVDSLSEASYLDKLREPAHTIICSIAPGSLHEELEQANKDVSEEAEKFPDTASLQTRLAVILNAQGTSTKKVFDHYRKAGGQSDKLLDKLDLLYNSSEKIDKDDFTEFVTYNLPKGWYTKRALLDYNKKFDDKAYREALARDDADAKEWCFRAETFLLADAVVALLGLISIVAFFRTKLEHQEPHRPMTREFRRMYGCLISTLFGQVLAAIGVGIYIGLMSALSQPSSPPIDQHSIMSGSMILAGTISAILLFYFLVLRPQALSINQAFTLSADRLNSSKLVLYCLGGFCAGNLLNTIGRLLYKLLPNAGRSTNPAHLEMVGAFQSGELAAITWSVTLAVVLAPITEEILFRGLLFGWLRTRVNSVWAILISSALFALWHFDPNGFVQYFTLGLVLGSVYNRTRNLWCSIMIHSLWNLWVVSTVYWITSYHH